MRARLFVAVVLVLGFVGQRAPGFQLSADQNQSAIVGNPDCELEPVPVATPPNPPATVVMCRLDNPRGLTFSRFALYVAEAGRGGFGLVAPPCFVGQAGGTRCYGPNGAITRLWNGVQTRVVTELPSHANLLGRQAIGPHDIAVTASANETAYVTIGLQQPPEFRERYPFLADFGWLARLSASGEWSYVADLAAYEAENDPDQEFYDPDKLDTNPYGLFAAPSGRAILVTDAGANSLLQIDANGHTSTRAVFEPHPKGSRDDSVPVAVEIGPDGAYYVAELTGFPVVRGAAHIYRLGAASESPEVCLTGFTQTIDATFDKQGNLYVLQYATNFTTQPPSEGTLIRVTPDRHAARDRDDQSVMCAQYAAGERTEVVKGLTQPTSIAVGPDGGLYISNRGISVGTGQVIRFEP